MIENNTGSRGKLAGKSTIVTGASRGIGAAIASRFASEGSDVLVNYSNSLSEASALVEKINEAGAGRAVLNRADVSKVAEIKLMASSALKEFGKIDILVNNAGVIVPKDFFSSSEEVAQPTAFSSVNYVASKMGVLGIIRALAGEFGSLQYSGKCGLSWSNGDGYGQVDDR